MWSSTVIPAVRISAARSSILPISSRGVTPWRYLETIEAAGEVGFGPRRLRAVPREERVPRFSRRGAPVQDTLVALAP